MDWASGRDHTPPEGGRGAEHAVFVLLIADGRRDFETLLQRRLLEP